MAHHPRLVPFSLACAISSSPTSPSSSSLPWPPLLPSTPPHSSLLPSIHCNRVHEHTHHHHYCHCHQNTFLFEIYAGLSLSPHTLLPYLQRWQSRDTGLTQSESGRATTARKRLPVTVAKNFTQDLAQASEDAEMAVDPQGLWAQNDEHFGAGGCLHG